MKSLSIKRKYKNLTKLKLKLKRNNNNDNGKRNLTKKSSISTSKKLQDSCDTNDSISMSTSSRNRSKTWSNRKMRKAITLVKEKHLPVTQVARKLNIPQSTLSIYLKSNVNLDDLISSDEDMTYEEYNNTSADASNIEDDDIDEKIEFDLNKEDEEELNRLLEEKANYLPKSWTNEMMRQALKYIMSGKSLSETSRRFNIPLSTIAIYHKLCQPILAKKKSKTNKSELECFNCSADLFTFKKSKMWSKANMISALNLLNTTDVSMLEVSQKFKIPMSTLCRYFHKSKKSSIDSNQTHSESTSSSVQEQKNSVNTIQQTKPEKENGITRSSNSDTKVSHNSWSWDQMKIAISMVKDKGYNIREISKKYNIPSETLQLYVKSTNKSLLAKFTKKIKKTAVENSTKNVSNNNQVLKNKKQIIKKEKELPITNTTIDNTQQNQENISNHQDTQTNQIKHKVNAFGLRTTSVAKKTASPIKFILLKKSKKGLIKSPTIGEQNKCLIDNYNGYKYEIEEKSNQEIINKLKNIENTDLILSTILKDDFITNNYHIREYQSKLYFIVFILN